MTICTLKPPSSFYFPPTPYLRQLLQVFLLYELFFFFFIKHQEAKTTARLVSELSEQESGLSLSEGRA